MTFIKTRIKNVYEDTSSGIYYLRIRRKDRRPLNKSLDTKNFKVATQKADELIREYLGHEPKRREHRLFKDEVKAFLDSYSVRVKGNTYTRIESVLRLHLMPYWQNRILTDITASEWDTYLKREMSVGGRNLSNDKKAMTCVLSFAVKEGRLSGAPTLTDPSPKSTRGRDLSDQELLSLLEASKAVSSEIFLAVLIAYKSGPRIGEIVSIPWKAVNLEKRYITVTGKTGPRKMAIGSDVAAHLASERVRATSKWLFPMKTDQAAHMSTNLMDKLWQDTKRAARVDCRFHDLRHTFITRTLAAGKSIVWVSKQVGSSVKTITQVYEHMNIDDISELGDVVSVSGEKGIIGVGLVQGDKP